MEDLKIFLRKHPFLNGLSEAHLELVVGCCKNVKFEEGKYLFKEGYDANEFYLIRAGRVALEIYIPEKGHVRIQTLEEEDVLGWSWLIHPYRWHFDAKAVETIRAISIDGKCLRRKCEEDFNLGYELFKRFSHIMENRVQALSLQLLDLYGSPTGGAFNK